MKSAYNYADCSSAVRLKVGAIIVKDDAIISIGYNGQPSGWDNICEDKIYLAPTAGGWMDIDEIDRQFPFIDENNNRYKLQTKSTVLHAESNAISKLAGLTGGGKGASLFVTHCPCLECAKLIHQTKIKEVFYSESYRSTDGIDFLLKCNIPVQQINTK